MGAVSFARALVRGTGRALTPSRALALAALVAAAALWRCAPAGPRLIRYGGESCAYCLMGVDDPRFGAELVTARGKVHVFDSPVCLAGYVRSHPQEKGATMWVTDFTHPSTLVPATEARYRQISSISGPMGAGLAALAPDDAAPPELSGPELTWQDVQALAERGDGREAAR